MTGANKKLPHVLITTPPNQGHLRPLYRLAADLAAEGHLVTLLYPIYEAKLVSSDAGDVSSLLPPNPHPSRLHIDPIMMPAKEVGLDVMKGWQWIENNRAKLIVHVHRRLVGASPPPCAIIYDQFCSWSRDLALSMGIPAVVFIASPLTYVFMALLADEFVRQCRTHTRDGTIKFPGLIDLPIADVPEPHGLPESLQYEVVARYFVEPSLADAIIVNDVPELAGDQFTGGVKSLLGAVRPDPRLWLIGPVGLPSQVPLRRLDEDVEQFLQAHPQGVMFISFGSWCEIPASHLKALAEGISLSKKPFVWALRDPVFEKDDPDSIYSSIRALEQEGRGIARPWIEQPPMLAAPQVAVFATHCGWNSLLEAFTSPQPMPLLCVPIAAEQPLNASLVHERWQSGIRVYQGRCVGEPECPDPHKVATAIHLLFDDHSYRQNADRLRRQVFDSKGKVTEQAAFHRWIAEQADNLPVPVEDGKCP